jgi:hypothetical protein
MVSSEGLLWYIFPVERLVGFFLVKLFFPAKKAQDERRDVVSSSKRIQTLLGPFYAVLFAIIVFKKYRPTYLNK